MIRNLETESLVFGDDDEFHRRLGEFKRLCLARIRRIFWIILSTPCNCWTFLKYLPKSITNLFLRQYIAVIVFVLSASILPVAIVVLRGDERICIVIYCLSFIASCFLSFFSKRGCVAFSRRRKSELLEQNQPLAEFICRNGKVADKPTGYGTKDDRQPLQKTSDNLMEPRPESKAGPAIGFHRSDSLTPLNYSDASSAGPSRALECTDSFTIKSVNDDSYNSDKPSQRTVARISADAVRTFGYPIQVFGADSYKVLLNEDCFSDEPFAEEVKTFEASVEVHHPDSYRPMNSNNCGSISTEQELLGNNESSVMVDSVLETLPYVDDDQSSETTGNDL